MLASPSRRPGHNIMVCLTCESRPKPDAQYHLPSGATPSRGRGASQTLLRPGSHLLCVTASPPRSPPGMNAPPSLKRARKRRRPKCARKRKRPAKKIATQVPTRPPCAGSRRRQCVKTTPLPGVWALLGARRTRSRQPSAAPATRATCARRPAVFAPRAPSRASAAAPRATRRARKTCGLCD